MLQINSHSLLKQTCRPTDEGITSHHMLQINSHSLLKQTCRPTDEGNTSHHMLQINSHSLLKQTCRPTDEGNTSHHMLQINSSSLLKQTCRPTEAVAASRGAWGHLPPPVGGSAPHSPPVRRKKWSKSAIFGKFFDLCPLRIAFCPLDTPHKKISGAATVQKIVIHHNMCFNHNLLTLLKKHVDLPKRVRLHTKLTQHASTRTHLPC